MPLLRLLWVFVVAFFPVISFAAAEVGEFDIPGVVPLDAQALEHMRGLVKENPEAAALAAIEKQRAQPLFDAQPRPLEVIHYEGLVNTDPRRIASVEKLTDMTHAAVLVRHWQATGDPQAADALKRYILAWSDTYRITGNDVNENKFHPLLVAYDALRGQFSTEERAGVDEWVEALGEAHVQAVRESDHLTNRYSKHLRLAATCGMILDRPEWVEAALDGVRRFVTASLYADGTSRDLEHRDALSYHVSSLKPPLELAMLAGDRGRALYQWESADVGSLQKSVEFVVPYAMGEKQYEEWRHSKVGLDRRRAEAGLEKYQPGHVYEPRKALSLVERAAYFDPQLMKVVHHLSDSEAERFPTWQTLVNAAAR